MSRSFRTHRLASSTAKTASSEAAAPRDSAQQPAVESKAETAAKKPKEIGGPSGPEPTRYGDWERKGICVDF